MLSERLDSGLLRLLEVIAALAAVTAIINPSLPVIYLPALLATALTAYISYRRSREATWWRLPALVFVVGSVLSLAATFFLLAQK